MPGVFLLTLVHELVCLLFTVLRFGVVGEAYIDYKLTCFLLHISD